MDNRDHDSLRVLRRVPSNASSVLGGGAAPSCASGSGTGASLGHLGLGGQFKGIRPPPNSLAPPHLTPPSGAALAAALSSISPFGPFDDTPKSVHHRYQHLTGKLLQMRVGQDYLDGNGTEQLRMNFFSKDGKARLLVRHMINDRDEHDSRARLKANVKEEGYHDDVRGGVWGAVVGATEAGDDLCGYLGISFLFLSGGGSRTHRVCESEVDPVRVPHS